MILANDATSAVSPHSWSIAALVFGVIIQSYVLYRRWQRRARLGVRLARDAVRAGDAPFASRPFWERVERGAFLTALVPGGCSVLILLWAAFGGRYQKIAKDDVSSVDVLELGILYLLGSIWMGAAIAAGAPLMRGFVSRSLVGMTAVAPLIAACVWAMSAGHWELVETVISASMILLYGVCIGHGVKRSETLRARARKDLGLAPDSH